MAEKNNNLQNKTKNSTYMYLSMFLTTMSLFIYETLLTRLFSAILSYSLVFIVVSFAILGSGIGAIISYRILKANKNGERTLILTSMFLPISFILSIGIMYFLPFTPTFLIYIPAALFPFILDQLVKVNRN
ncbi:hypothetical protein [Clostridium tyrobutyricum]|uniref:hypothetical protein n=1 Tax=Clostridium tyrobutyricum TaxID=1519 RepID=UPI0030D1DD4C